MNNSLVTPNQNRRSALDIEKVNHFAKSNHDLLKKSIDTQFFVIFTSFSKDFSQSSL